MGGRVRRLAGLMLLALALSGFDAATGAADERPAEEAIAERLRDWTAAFNARDAEGACDLFATDLAYVLPEVAAGTRETLCGNFARMFARPEIRLSYAEPDIHEILVSGDLAVVRLTWTLTIEEDGKTAHSIEEGMDVFRRQPDGRWSIARFVAFTPEPLATPP